MSFFCLNINDSGTRPINSLERIASKFILFIYLRKLGRLWSQKIYVRPFNFVVYRMKLSSAFYCEKYNKFSIWIDIQYVCSESNLMGYEGILEIDYNWKN